MAEAKCCHCGRTLQRPAYYLAQFKRVACSDCRKGAEVACAQCGKVKLQKAAMLRQGYGKYCSQVCAGKATRQRPRTKALANRLGITEEAARAIIENPFDQRIGDNPGVWLEDGIFQDEKGGLRFTIANAAKRTGIGEPTWFSWLPGRDSKGRHRNCPEVGRPLDAIRVLWPANPGNDPYVITQLDVNAVKQSLKDGQAKCPRTSGEWVTKTLFAGKNREGQDRSWCPSDEAAKLAGCSRRNLQHTGAERLKVTPLAKDPRTFKRKFSRRIGRRLVDVWERGGLLAYKSRSKPKRPGPQTKRKRADKLPQPERFDPLKIWKTRGKSPGPRTIKRRERARMFLLFVLTRGTWIKRAFASFFLAPPVGALQASEPVMLDHIRVWAKDAHVPWASVQEHANSVVKATRQGTKWYWQLEGPVMIQEKPSLPASAPAKPGPATRNAKRGRGREKGFRLPVAQQRDERLRTWWMDNGQPEAPAVCQRARENKTPIDASYARKLVRGWRAGK
jgi:hypothetical protein